MASSPSLPLILGLVIVGIVLFLGVIVYFQQRWRRLNTVRQDPFSNFVVDSGIEKLTGTHHSRRNALVPLLVQNIPIENSLQSPDPFNPYQLILAGGVETEIRVEPPRISQPEGVALLHSERRITSALPVPSDNIPSLPREGESQARRVLLSHQDLPPLTIPLSLKARSIPADQAIHTPSEDTCTATPDAPQNFSIQPSPIPNSSDSEHDTVSLYSQLSASTRLHGDLERRETPPPVPSLPIGLIRSQTLQLGENRREQDEDETSHRVPISIISGLLKSRAQKSGLKREFSQVSRIERANSIASEINTLLPSRRDTRKRRINEQKPVADLKEQEPETLARQETPSTIRSLPNPFQSAVSTPPSPTTTLSSLPHEQFVPSHPIEVTKSQSLISQKARFSGLNIHGEPS